MEKITITEAFNRIARKHGHADWEIARYGLAPHHLHVLIIEVMELYVESKWDEACQLQINSCLNNLRPTFSQGQAYGDIASAPKPKFNATQEKR